MKVAHGWPALFLKVHMNTPKISPQRKFEDMQARQREALRLEEVALDATRAKTVKLRAQRLERERLEKSAPAPEKAARKKSVAATGGKKKNTPSAT